MFNSVDWASLFISDTPFLEIIVRGTLVYLALFLMLRFVMRRQTGGIGVTDVLVIVMIADASQNAMAGDYNTVPDGILLVATILFWDFSINWLSYHWRAFGDFIEPKPLLLVRAGKIQRKNLRYELITTEELQSQLRLQGVDNLAEVKCAYMESDGKISVVTYDDRRPKATKHGSRKKADGS